MIDIPLADPGWVVAAHRTALLAAAERVLDSGWYILGAEVGAFEDELATWAGTQTAVGVASGTDAVAVALLACGIGDRDAVFAPAHTAVATVAAIASTGATPVLVDIDPQTYGICPQSLSETLDAMSRESPQLRPAAVVLVHLYGHPASVAAIHRVCQAADMALIEDVAQAHGATIDGRAVGSFGDAGAFSFYPTKNLGAIGDAGAIVTSRQDIAEEIRLQRQYGWRERYVSERVGRNSRLDEIQAAMLRVLLPHVDEWNAHRRALASRYAELLQGCSVSLPAAPLAAVQHVYHQFVIESPDRDRLAQHLASSGIGSGVLYPKAVHEQPAYRDVPRARDLEVSERVCRRVLSLPIGPHVTEDQIARVAAAVRSFTPA